jgi:hypothetical protein
MALITTGKKELPLYRHSPVAALLILLQEVEPLARLYRMFGPIKGGLNISISANWMWACKTKERMLVCTLP